MSTEYQKKLANSLRARKSHVTSRGKHLQEALDNLSIDSPAILCSRLKESLNRYEGAVKGVEETYIQLEEEVDGAVFNDWCLKHNEYIGPCEAKIQEAVRKIAGWEEAAYAAHSEANAAAAAGGAGGAGGARAREILAKAIDALRPETLEEDTPPLQYSSFKDKYRRYFNASNFHVLSIPQQQAYMMAVVADNLAIRLQFEDTDNLEACLAKIDKVFAQRFPWIRKLMDSMKYKQSAHQSASEFITNKSRLQREAGMMEMSVEKLAMADILASIEDQELLDEILKLDLKNATVDTIWQAGVSYDTRIASKKALSDTKQSARRVKSSECFKCGETGHFRDRCTKKVSCSICSSKNHCDKTHPKDREKAKQTKVRDKRRGGSGNREGRRDKQSGKPAAGASKSSKGGKPGNTPAPSPTATPASSRESSRSPSPTPAKAKIVRHKCSILSSQRSGKTGQSRPAQFRSSTDETPFLQCKAFGRAQGGRCAVVQSTPDSGCTKSIARSSVIKQCGAKLQYTSQKLEAANGGDMQVLGKACIYIKVRGVCVKRLNVLVSDDIGNDEMLLSWKDLIKLRVLPENFPTPIPEGDYDEDENRERCAKTKVVKPNVENNNDTNPQMEALHAEYEDVFNDRLLPGKRINVEPAVIELVEGAIPRSINHCRQYPLHHAEEAEALVAKLVKSKVLKKYDGPTQWCSPSHFVEKPGGRGLRLVSNFQYVNQYIKRPVMPDNTVDEVRRKISPTSKVFARYDSVSGFFQVPLSEQSQLLTATILPSGRYIYLNPPQGLSLSGDIYNMAATQICQGIPGLSRTCDDILIEAENYKQLEERSRLFLDRCREWGLTLSELKVEYGPQVSFGGYLVTSEGCRPDPRRVEALREADPPKDQPSLKSFLGSVQVLTSWIPDLAEMTGNLRQLVRKGVAYNWIPEVHGRDFQLIKDAISDKTLLSAFDKNLETYLYTDGSTKNGVGWSLMQKTEAGQWRLIQCGSISLKDAERRYSVIDTELLAMVYGIIKNSYYLRGCKVIVIVDHRPLVGLSKKGWDEITVRQARLFEKIQGFHYEVRYEAGKFMYMSDFLSRSPLWRGSEECRLRKIMRTDTAALVRRVKTLFPFFDDGRFDSLLECAKVDKNYQSLIQALTNGEEVNKNNNYYGNIEKMELINDDDSEAKLVALEGKLVIPDNWVSHALDIVHSHHLGFDLTLQNARSLYWWPQQKVHIKNMVESCQACNRHMKLSPETPWMRPSETYFESGPNFRHGIDMFQVANQKIMLLSDWWSGMTWLRNFGRHPSTKDVTDWLDNLYYLQGAPSYLRHDGGECFRKTFSDWCRQRGIKSQLSAAFEPTSNGFSERQVGLAKAGLKKMLETGVISNLKDNTQLGLAMSRLMMTPRVGGLSAADLFYGRKVRSPLHPSLVDISKCRITDDQWLRICEIKERKRESMLLNGPKSRKSSMQLSFKNDYVLETDTTAELKVDDIVLVYDTNKQLWCREATVCEVRPSGRSYVVQECKTGRKLLRSRRHLRREKGLAKRLHSNPHCKRGDVSAREECGAVGVTQSNMHAGHRSLKGVREADVTSPSPTTRGSTLPPPPTLPSPASPPATASTTSSAPRKVRFSLGTKRK